MNLKRNFQQAIVRFSYIVAQWNNQNLLKKYPKIALYSFDYIGTYVNFYGRYEGAGLEKLKEVLSHKGTNYSALDIGANIGNHSIFFSGMFEKVFAFEPEPTTFQLLRLNTGKLSNVFCYALGASSRKSSLNFVVDKLNMGNSRISQNDGASNSPGETSITIDVVAIDDVEEIKNERIGFIKIDVQGHELEVVRGMNKLIKLNSPIICFEQEASEISNGTSLVKTELENIGYDYYYSIDSKDSGKFSRYPNKINHIFEIIKIILFGDLSQDAIFQKIDALESRQYNMLIASTKPIN